MSVFDYKEPRAEPKPYDPKLAPVEDDVQEVFPL